MATFDRLISRSAGPMAEHAAGFVAELSAEGYCTYSIYMHLQLMAALSAWLESRELNAEHLSPAVAEEFVSAVGPTRHKLRSIRSLSPLLRYLDRVGVLPEPQPVPGSDRDVLLSAYCEYLRTERGVSQRTVDCYAPVAAKFLAIVEGPLHNTLQALSWGKVLAVLEGQLRGHSPAMAKLITKTDRSLLRFLYAEGYTPQDFSVLVPRVAGWRLSGLPARMETTTIEALLASCDRTTEVGVRDYAILLILARLGLRSFEITELALEDLNWRTSEVTVHGKGGRVDVFPLASDVGAAIADYLRVRRLSRSGTRAVFLTALPPVGPLTIVGLNSVVKRACRRAGVREQGPRALRHSLASTLLASGASLADVGEILRHGDPRTTSIYAKVDRKALARLIRPWPTQPEPQT
ncbi:tyrosine-type recombinase/integrase [Rhodococcus opacus]|uniref:tyrosine-type recombinase/integrase n=1 Tax=Rhodococcus opacus TaxID=37919 RepID=UPI0007CD649A|nr:tyrosine-type recombinase/integrase [Rhodococcus opacus]MDX5962536.1 tyrosine-type recombinase/integrase [Rhodococcus opacus]MDX5969863.1 tyrosine-type recombinase/integrase [Rhodococcus opacus]MDX5969973.1 tyrosine-type recombinase/integrase [Rhodococcus opacus]CAG7618052.1 Tyrosine recombinase XerC [Rhodococcus opacus]CAG7640831.1 Tyrosine recombinase XerC [Rhodococcus opacus]